jgi:hypothetical protein
MSDEHQRPQKDATADGTAGAEPEVDSPMHTALGGAPYNPPVASLLTIGDPHAEAVEASIAALSLGQEHVPELVRMAVDPALNNAHLSTLPSCCPWSSSMQTTISARSCPRCLRRSASSPSHRCATI